MLKTRHVQNWVGNKILRSMAILAMGLIIGSSTASANKYKAGSDFPNAKISSLSGKSSLEISKLKGKVVVVDFWASWCEPCKVELPALNAIYKKYKSQGLVVIGVNVDATPEEAKAFLKEHPVSFPIAYDGAKKTLVEQLQIDKMPTSFILDRNGKVVVRHEAFRHGDEKKIEQEIVKLLKSK